MKRKHYKEKPKKTNEFCSDCSKELTEFEIMYGHVCKNTSKPHECKKGYLDCDQNGECIGECKI